MQKEFFSIIIFYDDNNDFITMNTSPESFKIIKNNLPSLPSFGSKYLIHDLFVILIQTLTVFYKDEAGPSENIITNFEKLNDVFEKIKQKVG